MFEIRDRQGGNFIDSFDSLEDATYALNELEKLISWMVSMKRISMRYLILLIMK